jgi:PAS domain S-box-containing protein
MRSENRPDASSPQFVNWLARFIRSGDGSQGDGAPGERVTQPDPLLVESEARYRAVIENASDMIQSVRMDGTFEFVNRAWHEKLGYTPEDLPGMIIWDIIHPDSMDHCQATFMEVMQGNNLDDIEAVFITKDGRAVPSEGSATNRIVDGQIVATHSFFRDVTEKLRAQELEERNARLEQEQHARYLEKMAALGKLSAGLSHELNNPAAAAQRASDRLASTMTKRDGITRELISQGLTVEQWQALEQVVSEAAGQAQPASGPLETSQREDAVEQWLEAQGVGEAWSLAPALVQAGVSEEQLAGLAGVVPASALPTAICWISESAAMRNEADIVLRSTRRISELVGAVKRYSYMDRAKELDVDIHEGLENTIVILAHRLRNITVQREFDRSLPTVTAYGSALNQVWTNLIDNAVDATGGSGTITIKTGRADDHVVVEIADNGCGIPAEHVSRVFEPFFTTKPQGQGNGLGLDIAWRIVTEEHHGTIEVESIPGNTTFRVKLPLAASGVEAGLNVT